MTSNMERANERERGSHRQCLNCVTELIFPAFGRLLLLLFDVYVFLPFAPLRLARIAAIEGGEGGQTAVRLFEFKVERC